MFQKWFNTYIKANNVFVAQWPIILICWPLGMIPFILVRSPPNFRITALGRFMPFVCTIIYFISFGLTMFNRTISFFTYFVPNDMSSVVSYAQLSFFFSGILIVYGSAVFNRTRLIELFNLLSQIDDKFKTGVNVILDYSRAVKLMLKFIALHYFTYGAYITMNFLLHTYQGRSLNIYIWISYFMFHLVASVIILQFISVMSQLKYRFSLLREVSFIFFFLFNAIECQ